MKRVEGALSRECNNLSHRGGRGPKPAKFAWCTYLGDPKSVIKFRVCNHQWSIRNTQEDIIFSLKFNGITANCVKYASVKGLYAEKKNSGINFVALWIKEGEVYLLSVWRVTVFVVKMGWNGNERKLTHLFPLDVFKRGSVTGQRYWYEILESYARFLEVYMDLTFFS